MNDQAPSTLNTDLLAAQVADAELLLNYAVSNGIQVDKEVTRVILEAGAAAQMGWSEQTAADFLSAAATLAALLKPVSAESLRNVANYRSRFPGYRLMLPITMALLAALIVIYSATAFLFSTLSTNIVNNLSIANPLAVKLTSELGQSNTPPDKTLCIDYSPPLSSVAGGKGSDPSVPPPGITREDVIADLQTFATAIRNMYSEARRMNRLNSWAFTRESQDPFGFVFAGTSRTPAAEVTTMLELPAGLPDLALASTERLCVYQRVRYYAQSAEENATLLTGAVATYILPVLYALLGAGAYILRRLESQLRSSTLIREAHSPRFMTAAIAGAVVGLFNFGQGISVSPLAIAFLVGYAVDVFFTFLERLIQSLIKARDSAPS